MKRGDRDDASVPVGRDILISLMDDGLSSEE